MQKKIKMPRGVKEPGGRVKIAISIEQKLFDDVVRNAERRNVGFSESISDVLKCGVLCLTEAEEL